MGKRRFGQRDIPSIEEMRQAFAPVLKRCAAKQAVVFGSCAGGDAHNYNNRIRAVSLGD